MLERALEQVLFRSRWLMAPFYVGLVVSLLVLLFKFGHELLHFVTHAVSASESDIILGVLTLVDLTFTGNLVLIVIFSGYENFVSKIDPKGHPDWPEWMTQVDFAGLKQKLLASIVAISAIALLKAFMNLKPDADPSYLTWLVIIHVVFVGSSLVLAFSDKISAKGH
ncbi:TIGR00645 family protein [Aquabacter sediminis]|uniref:TIGR00645 family protein n=1 Tax=Aquabacter sediminis TaxID=3029197 RepID=UPI00237E5F15|nr:TIGR00645 family protein [Aquabacter sp. P-9]MDE1569514.1 TIGR00645 family protein [Aquabacter sp. P-9]